MRKFGILMLVTMGVGAASCAPMADAVPKPLTDKQAKTLSKELDGKIASAPVNCIGRAQGTNIIRVSDDILLYRVSGRLVYQNTLRSACTGLARDNDIIVTETFGGSYCKGDLLRLVDRSSGIQGPVCSLGEFVPYKKASG
jgi:hypothetical protein